MSLTEGTTSKITEIFNMSWTDSINYVLFKNPVSASVINSVSNVANDVLFKKSSTSTINQIPSAVANLPVKNLVYIGNPFLRLAGLSGAAAVVLGAYGAHHYYLAEGFEEQKRIYRTANEYHFIHSLALIGVPLCRFPKIAGSLLTMGMVLFCGTCYYDAFTGNKNLRKLTPIGGTFLIFGWLCLVI